MKRKLLSIILCSVTLLNISGCSTKVKPNTNTQVIEGDGKVLIHSNIMKLLESMGKTYEFIPLEYKGGLIRGIISPTKIENYTLDASYESKGLNPLRYTEYVVDGLDLDGAIKETGEVLSINELAPYSLDVSNPSKIVLKDRKRKVEKLYSSKVSEQFVVNEVLSTDSTGENKLIYKFFDENGNENEMNVNIYSQGIVVGNDNRYVYSEFGYSTSGDDISNEKYITILYDSQTGKFYESENLGVSSKVNNELGIMEVNNELYYFGYDGKVSKIILRSGKMLLEDYYQINLSENQGLRINDLYTNKTVNGDNVFINIETKEVDGQIKKIKSSTLNMKHKVLVDNKIGKYNETIIEKIFSGSDNLVSVLTIESGAISKRICKYEGGEYNEVDSILIDSYPYDAGSSIKTENIEDILYDNETNSFFIKRKVKIDKKESYQYEVLKLE